MIKFLIVDDDLMATRIHTSFVWQVPGFAVAGAAATGASALRVVSSLQPDLVLLDVGLPDINGLDLLPQLREIVPTLDAPVLTGARDTGTVRKAIRGGVVHYLMKPFTVSDLRQCLEHYRHSYRLPVASRDLADQVDINPVFGKAAHGQIPPKGSAETLKIVQDLLQQAGAALSAAEAATRLGISRVSARRYLEHLKDAGQAEVRLSYGVGRPERRYAWAPTPRVLLTLESLSSDDCQPEPG